VLRAASSVRTFGTSVRDGCGIHKGVKTQVGNHMGLKTLKNTRASDREGLKSQTKSILLLPYPILSYLILPCLTLSYLILAYLLLHLTLS
jgi:hypothetical protein